VSFARQITTVLQQILDGRVQSCVGRIRIFAYYFVQILKPRWRMQDVVDGTALLLHFGQSVFEGRRSAGDGLLGAAVRRPQVGVVAPRDGRQRRRWFGGRGADRRRHDGLRQYQRRAVQKLRGAERQRFHWRLNLLLGGEVHLLERFAQVGAFRTRPVITHRDVFVGRAHPFARRYFIAAGVGSTSSAITASKNGWRALFQADG